MNTDRLRSARQKFGLTQAELAERIGITEKQVNRIELGHSVPNSDTLALIADALNVSTDWLLGRTDDSKSHIGLDLPKGDERAVLDALRRGDKLEAVQIIVGDKA